MAWMGYKSGNSIDNMKNLIKIYKNEANAPGGKIVLMAAASGIAQSCLLGIITLVAKTASQNNLNFQFLMMYFADYSQSNP